MLGWLGKQFGAKIQHGCHFIMESTIPQVCCVFCQKVLYKDLNLYANTHRQRERMNRRIHYSLWSLYMVTYNISKYLQLYFWEQWYDIELGCSWAATLWIRLYLLYFAVNFLSLECGNQIEKTMRNPNRNSSNTQSNIINVFLWNIFLNMRSTTSFWEGMRINNALNNEYLSINSS